MLLNMNDENDYSVFNSAKYRLGPAKLISFNEQRNSFVILNHKN